MARQAVVPIRFATYGDDNFKFSRAQLCKEAELTGWFHAVTAYTPETLSQAYKESPFWDLRDRPGGGYWSWKFDVIRQELALSAANEIVVYLDAGCAINARGAKRFYEYIDMAQKNTPGMVSFMMPGLREDQWTTERIFEVLKCEKGNTQIRKTGQLVGGVLVMRNSLEVRSLFDDCWQIICAVPTLISDECDRSAQVADFHDPRCDQSLLSVMRKQRGFGFIPRDESWVPPFGAGRSLMYPFWALRRRRPDANQTQQPSLTSTQSTYISSVVLLVHNGLGDNITCLGILRALLLHYHRVHFICKNQNKSNLARLTSDIPEGRLQLEPVECGKSWGNEIAAVVTQLGLLRGDAAMDVLVVGSDWRQAARSFRSSWLVSRIRNPTYKRFCLELTKQRSSHLSKENLIVRGMELHDVQHIDDFYTGAGLSIDTYVNYWTVPSTPESQRLARLSSSFSTIVFCHLQASSGEPLSGTHITALHSNPAAVVLCTGENLYDPVDDPLKHRIAKAYVMRPLAEYIDIIYKATHIYVIDSCLSCMVIPLKAQGRLRANVVEVIPRRNAGGWTPQAT